MPKCGGRVVNPALINWNVTQDNMLMTSKGFKYHNPFCLLVRWEKESTGATHSPLKDRSLKITWEADIIGAHNSKIDQLWLNPKGLPAKGFTPTYTVGSLEEIKHIL